jgi:hypothetical protein
VRAGREFTVSAWLEPPDAMSAARFAGVHDGTQAFAFGGITTERPTQRVADNATTSRRQAPGRPPVLAGRVAMPMPLTVAAVMANAHDCASNLRTIVDDIRAQGFTNVRSIAAEMNPRGILTPRDASWHSKSAARLLARLVKR